MKQLVVLFLFSIVALSQVPSPQIPMSGKIGPGGNFPLFNSGTINISGNYTMTYPDMSASIIRFAGALSATATVTAPQAFGFEFSIQNATTGGHDIIFKGPTGTGVTIPAGQAVMVISDGTNYVSLSGIGGGGGGITSLNGATGPAVSLVAGSNITITPNGNNITIDSTATAGGSTALSSLTPATGTHTIDNASYHQTWRWTFTNAGPTAGLSFNEITPSTNAQASLLDLETLPGSQATPLWVTSRGTSNGLTVDALGDVQLLGTSRLKLPALANHTSLGTDSEGYVIAGSGGGPGGSTSISDLTDATKANIVNLAGWMQTWNWVLSPGSDNGLELFDNSTTGEPDGQLLMLYSRNRTTALFGAYNADNRGWWIDGTQGALESTDSPLVTGGPVISDVQMIAPQFTINPSPIRPFAKATIGKNGRIQHPPLLKVPSGRNAQHSSALRILSANNNNFLDINVPDSGNPVLSSSTGAIDFANLFVQNLTGSGTSCLEALANGTVQRSGHACGTGGGGGSTALNDITAATADSGPINHGEHKIQWLWSKIGGPGDYGLFLGESSPSPSSAGLLDIETLAGSQTWPLWVSSGGRTNGMGFDAQGHLWLTNPVYHSAAALGTDASGMVIATTVGGGGSPTGPAGGDLSGSYPNPTVSGLRIGAGGGPLPTTGSGYLRWNAGAWSLNNTIPLSSLGSATAGGATSNGNFRILWLWSLTTPGISGFDVTESTPSTGTDSHLVSISTRGGSVAAPLYVSAGDNNGLMVTASGQVDMLGAAPFQASPTGGIILPGTLSAPSLATDSTGKIIPGTGGVAAPASWSSLTNPTSDLNLDLTGHHTQFRNEFNAGGPGVLFEIDDETSADPGAPKDTLYIWSNYSRVSPLEVQVNDAPTYSGFFVNGSNGNIEMQGNAKLEGPVQLPALPNAASLATNGQGDIIAGGGSVSTGGVSSGILGWYSNTAFAMAAAANNVAGHHFYWPAFAGTVSFNRIAVAGATADTTNPSSFAIWDATPGSQHMVCHTTPAVLIQNNINNQTCIEGQVQLTANTDYIFLFSSGGTTQQLYGTQGYRVATKYSSSNITNFTFSTTAGPTLGITCSNNCSNPIILSATMSANVFTCPYFMLY